MLQSILNKTWLLGIAVIASLSSLPVQAQANADAKTSFWSDDRIQISPLASFGMSSYGYVLARKDGRWTARRADSPKSVDLLENEELISLLPSGEVRIVYHNRCHEGSPNASATLCSCIRGIKGETRAANGYGMCTSAFKALSTNPIAGLSAVLATGLYGWTGSTSIVYKLDVDQLKAAVVEAGVVRLANEHLYADYRAEVASAAGLAKVSDTIVKYERMGYDPDGALPSLRQTLASLHEQEKVAAAELAARRARELQEQSERLARERQEQSERLARQRVLEAERAAAALKAREVALVSFRKSLKSGDDTFCGPVIETKSQMVRIALRVQLSGFSSDQWLKLDEVYMPDQGCINSNGRLMPSRS